MMKRQPAYAIHAAIKHLPPPPPPTDLGQPSAWQLQWGWGAWPCGRHDERWPAHRMQAAMTNVVRSLPTTLTWASPQRWRRWRGWAWPCWHHQSWTGSPPRCAPSPLGCWSPHLGSQWSSLCETPPQATLAVKSGLKLVVTMSDKYVPLKNAPPHLQFW